jgi:hypothetical protein
MASTARASCNRSGSAEPGNLSDRSLRRQGGTGGHHSRPQHEVRLAQQAEHARSTHEVTCCQSRGILQEAEQPLEASALHPLRRAALRTGDKINRCPHAQGQPASDISARISCCGDPTHSRQKRNGLCASTKLKHSSTAAGSRINPMGGENCTRLRNPKRASSALICCGLLPITTIRSSTVVASASKLAVRSLPVQTGKRRPVTTRSMLARKRLSSST